MDKQRWDEEGSEEKVSEPTEQSIEHDSSYKSFIYFIYTS